MYEGEWKDDKKTGYGVLRSHRGATFEGTWLESTQDGYGVETYADGGKFLVRAKALLLSFSFFFMLKFYYFTKLLLREINKN